MVGSRCERRLFIAITAALVTFEKGITPEKRFEAKSSSDSSETLRLLIVRIVVVPDVDVHVLVEVKAEVELRDVVEDRQGQGHEDQAKEKITLHKIKSVLNKSALQFCWIFFRL